MPQTYEKSGSWMESPKVFVYALAAIEALVTLAAGFLARSYHDPVVGGALGFCVWFAGALITINGVAFQLKLDAAIHRELQAAIGKEVEHFRRVLGIFNAYHSVTQEDFKQYRDEALKTAQQKLEALTRGEAELEGDEYYLWLNEKMGPGTKLVHAVSCRPLRVYLEDNREKNWAHANDTAAAAGTQITRVFILDQGELIGQDLRSLLRDFILQSGVHAYAVWREDLQPAVLNQLLGGGFSIYDSDVVFYDRSYFESDIGLRDANASPRPIMPRASIYCAPHPKVYDFDRLFKGLLDKIPFSSKGSSQASYRDILTRVDQYLTKTHGKLSLLKQTSGETTHQQLVTEWDSLVDELKEFESTPRLAAGAKN